MANAKTTLNPPPYALDLSKYVETRLFGARPHIRGRRIPIATVAHNAHAHGWTIAQTATEFGLSENEVLAALLYYAENEQLIEDLEAAEQALLEDMSRQHGKS